MNTKNAQIERKIKNPKNSNESYRNTDQLVKTYLFGVGITNDSKKNILEYIINSIKNKSENYYVVTPNPEMMVAASRNSSLTKVLNGAKIALNDGVGLSVAGQLLGKPFKDRFTGVELVEELCKMVSNWPITVGFLGGREKIAEATAECLIRKYPHLKVNFISQEWKSNSLQDEVDILFVAFGFPKQELWMHEHLNKIHVKVMVGVGGAFDYISGKVPRAPYLLRAIGLEWLFRLVVQPWRLRRQLALPIFVKMIVKEKFRMLTKQLFQ